MISTSLPKENDTVTLTCTSTNAEWIEWSRVPYGAMLSPDNRTVTFSRIKRSNSGDYRCQAGNPVTMENSDSITITVAYGPENVIIKTRRSANLILLKCSSDSVPPATYHWRLNGTDIKKEQNELQVAQKVAEIEGTYTCVANNSLTQLTAMDSIYVNVTTESIDSTDQTSSNVTIAAGIGIVIAVLLLILVTVLAYLFAKHRQHKQQPDSTNNASSSPEGPVYENVQATQESHYEQLTHKDRAVYSTLASKAGKH
ncbi:cell adhesion molecule CEACAM16-like isoform X2 [Lithobates pipiens]